jgi:dolichol-phosphate mannosyltransferase
MNCKPEITTRSEAISFVIPVYNEQDSLADLVSEICSISNTHDFNYSIYLINDGSTDNSGELISELCKKNSLLKGIHLNHNSGKSAAYMAAFELVTGDVIITMDADLQDDPTELPRMLSALDESTDLVVGWKINRLDNEPLKKIPSAVYNFLKGILFGLHLHDSNCGYRVIRIKAARSLKLFGDRYRFIPELISMNGFKVKEQPVNHRPRMHGHSKYGSNRFVTGFFDLITVRYLTGYNQKPL